MVKQRMTALDVRASVEEMRAELRGLRLLNVYDISPKMFLFKFGQGENKKMLLLESGVRLHLTQLVREKPKVPSQFTLKLRKHVRAWRLDSVTQLQHDRTVDFRFGAGEGASYHIIVELFSKGNVVLTDNEHRILLLLRTHRDDDIKMFVRELYPVTRPFEEQQRTESTAVPAAAEEQRRRRTEALRQEWHTVFARHADYETLRSTLSAVHHFGPALADHILTVTGVRNAKKGELNSDAETLFALLLPGMLQAWEIAFSPLPGGGYLIAYQKQSKGRAAAAAAAAARPGEENTQETTAVAGVGEGPQQLQAVHYDDFGPVLLAQYGGDRVATSFLKSFGAVCDAFFLCTETERIEQHNEKKTTSVLSKRSKFERDHQRRLGALEAEELANQRKGECIIQNAEKIDEAIGLINGALAAGIQWDALRGLLKRRHAEGHPVAYMVHELFLERNSISVLVEANEPDDDEDAEDCDVAPLVIEVELSKTAYANAAAYFAKKKSNRAKYEKTVAATAKALAGAEKKGERLAAKQKTKKAIVKERHRFWWEKFAWFRTSAGDLVLQGKDTQTTEILVRRVMQLGDVFVHSDVDGALPCLLRPVGSAWTTAFVAAAGESPPAPQAKACRIHMTSLDEAGAWCVSRSSAWEGKFTVAAWWVHASQITGGTASGCYLYDGEKHYLRPQPLTFACGLLFRVTARRIDPTDHDELPNFIAEGERRLQHEEDGENGAFLPPDGAAALHPLPSIGELRGPRRPPPPPPQRQQQPQGLGTAAAKASQMGMTASDGGRARRRRRQGRGRPSLAEGHAAADEAPAEEAEENSGEV
ncbi:uncharacterized protein Tco025E_09556 [Trypanosoma conorhini]|uniref:NFACT RNA-binding domain-containing protein n=1 Tax=Trypanosoma conorhini TaxID=83891 RepID=A0A3R7KLS8_9TRYP|nr:uncharacterized protein Tco025E_09556 [Trypanosoma conorhini]RNE97040.1 hypothetical protein Tco025E_09556 [Trypanosoma conorhini]